MRRWTFALVSLLSILVLTVVFPTVASGQELKETLKVVTPRPRYKPGEVMVRFRPGVRSEAMYAAHAAVHGQVIRKFPNVPGLEQVRLPEGMSVEDAVTLYQRNPNVLHAHPNYIDEYYDIPDDPKFAQQWGLNNTGQTGGTPDADIDAPEAWTLTKGSSDVVVAVIDSGIDYNHPDLMANMFRNEADCNSNGIDDDGNGYVDDCHGIDAADGDSDPMDDVGHGTHVAGIIGAVGNNSIGVVGVNWNVKIMICRAGGIEGPSHSATITCMHYIAGMKDRGVNIVAVNASFGGSTYDPDVATAIDDLRQKGILFVASAGNGGADQIGDNNDHVASYPSNIYLPNILAVANTTSADALATSSNYGRHSVHLGAPGDNILSTMAPGSAIELAACPGVNALYCSIGGTSMAAPFVTGVAALLKARNPSLDWRAIKNLILAGGDNTSALADKTITEKRLNANGALTCSNSTLFAPLRPVDTVTSTTVSEPLDLSALHINCAQPDGDVQVDVNGGQDTVALLDNGAGSDQVAGDGIYSGQFAPVNPGSFLLTFPDSEHLVTYVLRNYQSAGSEPVYRTITGTNLDFQEGQAGCFNFGSTGFRIRFGGASFSGFCLAGTGFISLTDLYNPDDNSALPYGKVYSLVAPFWDQLAPEKGTSRNIYYSFIGTAPNREFVLEWRDVHEYSCTSTGGVTFQVVFSENKSDILFNYKDVSFGGGCSAADNGGSATVGVQVSQKAAAQYSFNSATLADNTSILWTTGSLSVAPSTLDFGGVAVGTTSEPKTLTLSNESGSTITISAITPSGDFAKQNDTCTGSLAASANCTVDVAFTPTAAGTRDGELTITSTPGGEQKVSLVGNGLAPAVVLSPSSLNFGQQGIGSSSDPKPVTLKNDGGAPLTITDIRTTTADFTWKEYCGTSLGAGQECSINVTFKPTAEGTLTGELKIETNAASSPDAVGLSGEGVPAPLISLSPASLSFGSQKVNVPGTKSVVLTNTGTGPLSITSAIHAEPNPPFAATDNCGGSVAVNASCTIQVTFTPSAEQSYSGQLTIDSNAESSPDIVVLTGEGTSSAVTLDHASLDFGRQMKTTSQELTVKLTNSGGASLNVAKSEIIGQDAQHFQSNGQDCTNRNPIAPQQNCTITVTFTPATAGLKTATLQVTSDDPSSPHNISLSGTGTDFSVGMASGSSDSASVDAGQSANFNLNVAPIDGFQRSTTLSCTWKGTQPQGTSCSVSPSTVNLDGTEAANVTVSVTTTARSMAPVGWQPQPPAPNHYPLSYLAIWLLGLAALASLGLRRRRVTAGLASVLFLVVLWTACGGGGGGGDSTPTPITTGTPAGTYSLTVTGTTESVSHATSLTLVVK